ncbi:hypothetical protein [Agrobacterium tumefaciens]|uniref:hypothetical protein n=1 Tax=Agrobacterium tumefaciens TaxID=358 RepID=UPI0015723660|nr:hypothetical protein [Agrobacterium tumefaciens]NTB41175.1 hypothetical protein [Agrobacterium tumefaciens]NTC96080.1 hypothetical protein [Agrobacterium tumefaciens]
MHWLDGIEKIILSDSDDLAELARMAGYDPADFYRGTLTDEQIRRDVLKIEDEDIWELTRFHGPLGSCEVHIPPQVKLANFRGHAVPFTDVATLQVAFLRGALDEEAYVFIYRGYKSEVPAMASLYYITAVLELMQARGHRVALIVDGHVETLAGPVLAAANFERSSEHTRGIFNLKTTDEIEFDVAARKIHVSSFELSAVSQGEIFGTQSFASRLRFLEKEQSVSAAAANQTYTICAIADWLSNRSAGQRRFDNAYLRMFEISISSLQSLLKSHRKTHPFPANDIIIFWRGLVACSELALTKGFREASQIGTSLLEHFEPHLDEKIDILTQAQILSYLGNFHAMARDYATAVEYLDAGASLISMDPHRPPRSPEELQALGGLGRRLSHALSQVGSIDNAIAALKVAYDASNELLHYPVSNALLSQIAKDRLDLVHLLMRSGNHDEGLEYAQKAVDVTDAELRETPASTSRIHNHARSLRILAQVEETTGDLNAALRTRSIYVLWLLFLKRRNRRAVADKTLLVEINELHDLARYLALRSRRNDDLVFETFNAVPQRILTSLMLPEVIDNLEAFEKDYAGRLSSKMPKAYQRLKNN